MSPDCEGLGAAFIAGMGSSLTQLSGISYFSLYPFLSSFFFCVCVEVLRPNQPNGVMSSAVSLPNHTFTGQA